MPGNAMKTCSRYQYWSISHDLGGIAYVYQLKGHESRLGRDCLCHGKATSYDSTLVVECRYRLMHPGSPTQSTETQSPPPSPSPPGTALELDRTYHPHVFYEDIEWESHDCMLSTGLTWQIPFRRTLGGMCIDLAINRSV